MSRPNTSRHAGRIPLHNFEGTYRRTVTRTEAEGLLELGHAYEQCRRCNRTSLRGRCIGGHEHQLILRNREPESVKHDSPSSLTRADAEALVGITHGDFGMPANGKRVQAARDKFEVD